MSAIANGLALHGGFIPYVGTFLTFSDYARNAVRMAALMKLRSIFVFTHDSIGLGEDGPTHQAVEHTASLRLIPGLDVWRPCDTIETAAAWVAAIERARRPDVRCILTRQNVPFQARDAAQCADIRRGGYVLADWGLGGARRVVIIATGSEVALAMGARTALADEGIDARVVSMPCTSVFERQDDAYRASVLPPGVPRVAVEAGVTAGWRAYVGAADDPRGAVVGLDTFGESAPARRAVQALRVHRRRGRGGGAAGDRRMSDNHDAMSDLVIRVAVPDDARAIAQVRVDAWRTTYKGMIPDAYLAAMKRGRQRRRCGRAC